tara:strand:+ start:1039 stop:1647 length:609 start_codon:yes stop_codon:yes gene_type:complete
MKALTKVLQEKMSPTVALNSLLEGNKRFTQQLQVNRDLMSQVFDTATGQFPFAAILSCIDSRVPAEIVFDQGIGDLFSVRVAGNVVNADVLGSLEYACKVAGSKLVLVMGHTKCGAVTAACENVELGNITSLLAKIKPAIALCENNSNSDAISVENVSVKNVAISIETLRKESPILAEMEQQGLIQIVGAIYDVASGIVSVI